jgi:hypothetical protein
MSRPGGPAPIALWCSMTQTEYPVTSAGALPPLSNTTLLVSSFPLVTPAQINVMNAALNSHTRHYLKSRCATISSWVRGKWSFADKFIDNVSCCPKPKLSQYSDGLRDGRPGLISGRNKGSFFYTTWSRPNLELNQPPIKWGNRGWFRSGKAAGGWSWPFTSNAGFKNGVAKYPLPHMSSWHSD